MCIESLINESIFFSGLLDRWKMDEWKEKYRDRWMDGIQEEQCEASWNGKVWTVRDGCVGNTSKIST